MFAALAASAFYFARKPIDSAVVEENRPQIKQ
jgi:hypothetical protein